MTGILDFSERASHDAHLCVQTPTEKSAEMAKLKTQEDWSALTQDILDTPSRAWSRGLLYLLVGFACIALPWTMLARVDQTGQAQGRLEPSGKTIRLDAPVAGTVAQVKVKAGETVKRGQVLLVFESDLIQGELQQARSRLEGQRDRRNQLVIMQTHLQTALRTQQLHSQAQISEQTAQLNQIQQQLSAAKTAQTLENSRLEIAQNKQQRYQVLWEAGAVSTSQLDEIKAEQLESQQLFEQAEAAIQQALSEVDKQESTSDRIAHTGKLSVLDSQQQLENIQAQLTTAEIEIEQTENEIKALQFQLQQQVVKAPQDGTIFQMPVDHAGTVLQPGQMVAQIAPQDASLILRAQMPSPESGFLKIGMPVKLKFDAYPFQDYGVVEGHLRWISPDSQTTESEPNSLTFELEIALDHTYIQMRDKQVALTPGQTATAEIIIQQRRIIDILIDPFKKLSHQGLKL